MEPLGKLYVLYPLYIFFVYLVIRDLSKGKSLINLIPSILGALVFALITAYIHSWQHLLFMLGIAGFMWGLYKGLYQKS